ncbi:MAG: DnaJ domain-containing protein [bacterium]
MSRFKDYYQILQVSPNTEAPMIRRAYRLLALRYHPDRMLGQEEKMIEVTEAYDVLIDPERRKSFDKDYYKQKDVFLYSYQFKIHKEEMLNRSKEREEYYKKKEEEMLKELIKHKEVKREKFHKKEEENKDERIKLFLKIIKDPRNSIEFRWKAKMKLVEIREPTVLPLIDELSCQNHEVRYFAAVALGEIGDLRAVEPLIERLKDKWELVRNYAAESLGRLKDKRAIPPLLEIFYNEQESEEVRFNVKKALETLEYNFEEDKINQRK